MTVPTTKGLTFRVSRTSGGWPDEKKPCKGARPATFPVYDCRTCKTPQEFNDRKLGDWFGDEGYVEHGTYPGGIRRRHAKDEEGWAIDLPDLAALLVLAEQEGELIVKPPDGHSDGFVIEIYDDYRE